MQAKIHWKKGVWFIDILLLELFYVVAGKMAKHIISEKLYSYITEKLYSYITEKLTGKYGQDVDPLITKRLEEE